MTPEQIKQAMLSGDYDKLAAMEALEDAYSPFDAVAGGVAGVITAPVKSFARFAGETAIDPAYEAALNFMASQDNGIGYAALPTKRGVRKALENVAGGVDNMGMKHDPTKDIQHLGRGWNSDLNMSENAARAKARGMLTSAEIARKYKIKRDDVISILGNGEPHHVGRSNGVTYEDFYDPSLLDDEFTAAVGELKGRTQYHKRIEAAFKDSLASVKKEYGDRLTPIDAHGLAQYRASWGRDGWSGNSGEYGGPDEAFFADMEAAGRIIKR